MDSNHITWRMSSYTGGNGNCVEVGVSRAPGWVGLIAIRDSKDPDGPMLVFKAEQWRSFIGAVKSGT